MKTIDRLLASGLVELKETEEGVVVWRGTLVPDDLIADLPQNVQDAIAGHWTPERVAAWRASIAKTPEEIAAGEEARAEGQRGKIFKADAARQQLVAQLKTATPEQINTYVDNQVTDLASARTMFKRLLLVLATIVRS